MRPQQLLFLFVLACAACEPSADERCGSRFYWDSEQLTCWPNPTDSQTASDTQTEPEPSASSSDSPTETASESLTASESASESASGSVSESETPEDTLPSGLGDTCASDDDCKGKDALYCVKQPSSPTGYCSLNECQASPDDCPPGYACCVFAIPSILPFCATLADFDAMGTMCGAKATAGKGQP